MRTLRFAYFSVLFILLGCARHTAGTSSTAGIEERAAMKAALEQRLPPGTPVAEAKRFMKSEGFACTLERSASFGEERGIDYIYCDRSDRFDTFVSRRWQVAIVIYNDSVDHVLLSDGLIGF